jgi:UDPglucose 6-dehydrogenase
MGLDRRIGMKFLHPGPGYGGSCFPKDTQAALAVARAHGEELRIVKAATDVNARRPDAVVTRMEERFGSMEGRTVAVLGLTFKPNTDDLRESPALRIIERMKKRGATVRAYDPVGLELAAQEDPDLIPCADEYDAAQGADLLILATEWNQFRNMDLGRLKEVMNAPNVADLRNIYQPAEMRELGFEYMGVGR